jgi:hypothetical protein
VFADEGPHWGPLSTESIMRAIHAGDVVADAWVAPEGFFEPPGASGWRRITDTPELSARVRAETGRTFRVLDGGFKPTMRGTPEFSSKVLMVGIDNYARR